MNSDQVFPGAKSINANDPAFPLATVSDAKREEYIVHQFHTGMSIRVWLAGQALVTLCMDNSTDHAACMAVKYADALIEELNKEAKP